MSTPLIETNDAGLITRAYNLGLKIVPNLPHILSADELSYWENNLAEMKEVLARGLARSGVHTAKVVIPERKIEPVHLPQVVLDGRTGKQFIQMLEKKKFRVGEWAKDVMVKGKNSKGSLAFTTTNGVVYKPVILLGEQFSDEERVTSNIRRVASEMKLVTPPAEVAPLLREIVSDEDIEKLGLVWLAIMHEPIFDSGDDPRLLGLGRDGDGRWLFACDGRPAYGWNCRAGFVFLAPQD